MPKYNQLSLKSEKTICKMLNYSFINKYIIGQYNYYYTLIAPILNSMKIKTWSNKVGSFLPSKYFFFFSVSLQIAQNKVLIRSLIFLTLLSMKGFTTNCYTDINR